LALGSFLIQLGTKSCPARATPGDNPNVRATRAKRANM
jgi:hypothetical protein